MLTPKGNIHGSKLPTLGAIGYLKGLSTVNPHRRCILVAYPLTDSTDYRYSIGIHTVFVGFLDNGEMRRISGIWFESEG